MVLKPTGTVVFAVWVISHIAYKLIPTYGCGLWPYRLSVLSLVLTLSIGCYEYRFSTVHIQRYRAVFKE